MMRLPSSSLVKVPCLMSKRQLVSQIQGLSPLSGTNPRYATTKVSALSLTSQKRQNKKFTMVTAYDFPSAVHVARSGMDIILVGDSVGMVELGHDTTQPVTMDDMVHHCGAVKRGVDLASKGPDSNMKIPLLVGDMPLGSYEYRDTDIALRNAYRFIKEAGMDAVKLEVRQRPQ